ncbi:MAG: DUF962 domain-containing protein [Myxococcales bacterium]|nr:DUF962 domain-containing protein [Myxococcales bacterium]MCB9522516.1 DUF962 domain-containing protein [Myxococcales bacterium]
MARLPTTVINKVLDRLDRRTRGVALTVGGMGALMTGGKATAIGLLSKGLKDIEAEWRAQHPDFQGGVRERWQHAIEFYEQTHQDPTNRKLHIVGIPIIVGGTTGLLIWPRYTPPWFLSAGAFGFGWALNFVGHGLYEKNAPAFADDPLSFVAGPIWDLMHLKQVLKRGGDPMAAAA